MGGPSPFLTERARTRAPQVLSYAAVAGAAMLVSPLGAVVLFSGDAPEVDADKIARIASALAAGRDARSFRVGAMCVHAAPVCLGWTLCVLSTAGVHPIGLPSSKCRFPGRIAVRRGLRAYWGRRVRTRRPAALGRAERRP